MNHDGYLRRIKCELEVSGEPSLMPPGVPSKGQPRLKLPHPHARSLTGVCSMHIYTHSVERAPVCLSSDNPYRNSYSTAMFKSSSDGRNKPNAAPELLGTTAPQTAPQTSQSAFDVLGQTDSHTEKRRNPENAGPKAAQEQQR